MAAFEQWGYLATDGDEEPHRPIVGGILHAVSPDGPSLDELRDALRVAKAATAQHAAEHPLRPLPARDDRARRAHYATFA